MDKPCVICYKPDEEKSTIYRGTPWCCGQHRKMANAPIPACGNPNHDHESGEVPGHGAFCADCLRPIHYNTQVEDYFHNDPEAYCFLHNGATDLCRPPKAKMKATKKSR